jgi:hypothetical protein
MTKVFEVRGDVDINTKEAERALDRMARSTRAFGDSMLQADRISVSLTRRLRSGFTTGMIASLKRDEGGFLALGNAIQVAGAGLRKIENESVLTLRAFQRFQRGSAALQTILGTLVGSIGALSGGFLSLIGILGQAAFAFVGVGSAVVSVVAGFAVARIAMSGVGRAVSQLWNGQNQYNRALRDARKELKDLRFDLEGAVLSEKEAAIELEKARTQLAMAQDLPPDNMVRREAELAYQRADLNYRRAKSRVNDLQDTIKRGGNAAGRAANADPFRNLTKSQIAFTKYLVTLKPQLQALKEASAASFLPPLQTAIETIVNTTFPTLMKGFDVLGGAMGYAANEFANIFKQEGNIDALRVFFENSASNMRLLGESSGRFMAGFLNMLKAAQPLTERFISWVDNVSRKFETLATSSSFSDFLSLAGYVASQIGLVFSSFSEGIGNIMKANFLPNGGGAGQVLLDWLKGIARGFEKFTGSETFATWLKDTTVNATVMLSVIGDFLNIFVQLADRPEVKQFWTTLQGAIPSITKMLMDGLKAGPSFAALIVSVTKLMAIFSDAEGLIIFFDTLRGITDFFVELLAPMKPFLDAIGRVHFWILAVTGVMSMLTLGGVVIMAIFGQFAKILGRIGGILVGTVKWMTRFNLELAVGKPGIIGWGKALYNSIFGATAPTGKLKSAMDSLSDSFRRNKIVFREWLEGMKFLNEGPSRFSKFVNAVKIGFSALKATVMDAGLYIRTSLTDAIRKFRDVAGPALSNAKFAIYTTLIQKGRMISDLYNTRVVPAINKFRDIVVNKFNDARLAVYTTLLQKGRMVADLYNTRVVPAFRNFVASLSPQAIQMKMRFFAMGILMHIDLLDKRIIPAFMRIREGIRNSVLKIGIALSPQNIRLKMMGFTMGMLMHIDLLDKRIIPAFMRVRDGIKNAITQIGVALSPSNIQAKMSAIAESIRLGVARIGAAMSPENIRLKTLGFRIGMMMQIDLIDKRIIPAFIRLGTGIRRSLINMRLSLLQVSDVIRRNFADRLYLATERLQSFMTMVKFNIAVLGRMNEIVIGVVRDAFRRFRTAVMQSTVMIKLHTAATKLAAAASQMWNGLTSKLSNVFRSVKDSLGGFINRMKQKTAAVQASTAAEIADTTAIKNKTKALTEQQAAAAAAAGARRGGAGMAIMGAGFAAQGLISGASEGGMTTGSALTTLGGAMMFIPGGMIAGLAVGIVGAIVQGFESAERKKREEEERIQAEKIEMQVEEATITANKLNEKKSEFASILGQKGMTAEKAIEILNTRQQAVTDAATKAGLTGTNRDALDQFRRLLLDQGISEKSAGFNQLITAGAGLAKTLSAYGDVDPQALLAPIMSTFKSEGVGGLTKYGQGRATDPTLNFVPGSGNTLVRLEGNTSIEAIADYRQDKIQDLAKNAGYLDRLMKATLPGTTSLTAFSKDIRGVTGEFGPLKANPNETVTVTKQVAYDIIGKALGTGAFDAWARANPVAAMKANPSYAASILGTANKPAVVSVKPAPGEIDKLRLITDNTKRTDETMRLFKSAIVDGKLRVEDVSKSDNVAPLLIAPPGASKEYKEWLAGVNAQLSASFAGGN